MELITCNNIKKTYNKNNLKKTVLNEVSLSILPNEFILILGPSGSGKTTLINILATLESFDSGDLILFNKNSINIKNKDILNIRANKIGFVFQDFNLINSLNVYENILLANTLSKEDRKDNINKLIEDLGLKGFEKYYPAELSGGMKQRVAIARALINNQSVIFADEPTGNLDSKNTDNIMKLFKKINKKYNTSIAMVTHDENLVEYASRVIKILDGEIVYDKKKN